MSRPHNVNKLRKAVTDLAKVANVSVERITRHVGYNALLGLLYNAQAEGLFSMFFLKGGSAIELRFGMLARASKDVDIGISAEATDLMPLITQILERTWDEFTFGIKSIEQTLAGTVRIKIKVAYKHRDWVTLSVDLTSADTSLESDLLASFELSALSLPSATPVPVLNIFDQIAQKIHAVTDPASIDRYRDVIDILLLTPLVGDSWSVLREKCERVFLERNRHVWPPTLTVPTHWPEQMNRLLDDMGMAMRSSEALQEFNHLIMRIVTGMKLTMAAEYRYVHFTAPSGEFSLRSTEIASVKAALEDGFRQVSSVLLTGMHIPELSLFLVFEKLESSPERLALPRLHMRLREQYSTPQLVNLSGTLRSISATMASQISLSASSMELVQKLGDLVEDDSPLEIKLTIPRENLEKAQIPCVVLQYRSEDGGHYEQIGRLLVSGDGWMVGGLNTTQRLDKRTVPYFTGE